MSKIFEINIKEDIVENFKLALMVNKEECNEVIERFMIDYITSSFSAASQKYKSQEVAKNSKVNELMNADKGKARNRIPKWAVKPEQYNHKIVRAYFQVESELGFVPLEVLERRCSDEVNYRSTYVRDFRGNFNQMKMDNHNSHGKVFEVNNGKVIIWDYVKDRLMEYKEYFFR
ncbi:MAG: hypothetical protein ACK4M9_19445 [Anaerobacillus sp.]|uniref:hypothetical protein n=1 Tax=Anaerobacillus sp. TaxID=1872506 RepID=UPI00391BCC00